MAEPIWVPIVIACVNGSFFLASEYLGSRDPSNPNLCRSVLSASYSGFQYVKNKLTNNTTATAQVELSTITSNTDGVGAPSASGDGVGTPSASGEVPLARPRKDFVPINTIISSS